MANDKLNSLYTTLTKDGYELGDINTFTTKMQDPAKVKALHDQITKDGYDVGDINQFTQNMGVIPMARPEEKQWGNEWVPSQKVEGRSQKVGQPLTDKEAMKAIYGNVPGTTKIGDVSFLPTGGGYKNTKGKASVQKPNTDVQVAVPAESVYGNAPQLQMPTITSEDIEKQTQADLQKQYAGNEYEQAMFKQAQDISKGVTDQEFNPQFYADIPRGAVNATVGIAGSTLTGVGDLYDKAGSLSGIDFYADYGKKLKELGGKADEYVKKHSTGSAGEQFGGMVPMAGMAIADIASGGSLTPVITSTFAASGYGDGIKMYDELHPNGDGNAYAKTGAGLLYGAVMAGAGNYLMGKAIPKGLISEAVQNVFRNNPELLQTGGEAIVNAFAKQQPILLKQLARNAGHSVMSMEAMELGKKGIDELYGKHSDAKEWINTATHAAVTGVVFSALTAPFSIHAQSAANTARRNAQGNVTLTFDAKGKPVEVIEGLRGLTPDGKEVKLTQENVNNSFTMTTSDFNRFMEQKGNAKVNDRDVFSNNVADTLKRMSGNGNVSVARDEEGNALYVVGQQDGKLMGLDVEGQVRPIPEGTDIQTAPIADVHSAIMAEYDKRTGYDPRSEMQDALPGGEAMVNTQIVGDPMDPQVHADAVTRAVASKQQMDEAMKDAGFGIDENTIVSASPEEQAQIVQDIIADEEMTPVQKDAVIGYIDAMTQVRTLNDARQEQRALRLQQEIYKANKLYNPNSGTIVTGTLKWSDEPIQIIHGLQVMPTADGTGWEADVDNSDVAVYYKDSEGKTQVTTADDVVVTGNEHLDERIQAVQQELDAEDQAFQQQLAALVSSVDNGQLTVDNSTGSATDEQQTEVDNSQPTQGDVEYPLDKNGNVDFGQFTPEHHYRYAVETEGEDVANEDLKNEIARQEKELGKFKKKIADAAFEKKAVLRSKLKDMQQKLDELTALKAKYISEVQPEAIQPDLRNEKPQERNARWGEPQSLRELILRKFIDGARLRWSDKTSDTGAVISKGLGAEYRGSNDERKSHFGFLSAEGQTPEEMAHQIWQANAYEPGQFEDMPLYGVDTQDILGEILDVMNTHRSTGTMINEVEGMKTNLSSAEQAYIDQLQHEHEQHYLEEYDDETFAQILGLTNFTPEQLQELQNLLNDGTDITTTGGSQEGYNPESAPEPGAEMQGTGNRAGQIATNEGRNEPGGGGLEGNSEKQPIGQLGTGSDVYFDKSGIRVNAQSNSDKILLNVTLKGETFADTFEFDTPEEAVSVAETLYKLYPKGIPNALLIKDVVESIKRDLGIEPVEQLTKAEQDTPDAVEIGNDVVEKQEGSRFITDEEAKKIYHHTGEKALANDLYSNFDDVSRAQHRYEEYGLKKTISIQGREVEATLWYDGKNNDQPRISYQYTDNNGNVVKQTLLLSGKKVLNGGGFQFNRVSVKSELIKPFDNGQLTVENKLQAYDAAVDVQERVQIGTEIIRELEAKHGLGESIITGSHEEMADVYPEFNQKDRNFVLDGNVSGCFYNGKLAIDIAGCDNARVLIGALVHENIHRTINKNYTAEELESIHDQIPLSELKYVPVEDRTSKQRIADEWLAYTTESLLENNTVDDILSGNVQNWGTLSPYTQEQITNILNTQRNGKSKSRTTTPERKGRSNRNNAATGRAGKTPTVSENIGAGAEANKPGTTTGDTGRSISGPISEREKLLQEKLSKLGSKLGIEPRFKTVLPSTIVVDGKERPTTNSNGQAIHGTEEGIRNFWKWFGDSKVVDKDGRPLVVYHGTKADFDAFSMDNYGTNGVLSGKGFNFTSNKAVANNYGKTGSIMPVYLKSDNPFYGLSEVDATTKNYLLHTEGDWDSVIQSAGFDSRTDKDFNLILVYQPTQIKSAIGNDGSFDPNNADIRFKRLDPETNELALDVTEMLFEDGHVQFSDYANKMIGYLGEGITPYLKPFYELARVSLETPGMSTAQEVHEYKFESQEPRAKSQEPEVKSQDVAHLYKNGDEVIYNGEKNTIIGSGVVRGSNEKIYYLKNDSGKISEDIPETELNVAVEKEEPKNAIPEELSSQPGFTRALKELYIAVDSNPEGFRTDDQEYKVAQYLQKTGYRGKWIRTSEGERLQFYKVDQPKLRPGQSIADFAKEVSEKNTTNQDNKAKKQLSLFDETTTPNGSTGTNTATQSDSGRISDTDNVGTGTSVGDLAGNSEGQRVQSGNGSSESGVRPQYDVNKRYSNEEIHAIVSTVTSITDGKVHITGPVTDDVKTIAEQYVSGGVAKEGRGVLDEYYTELPVVDEVRKLIAGYFPQNKAIRVLEPSVGTGNFLNAIPTDQHEVTAFEINETTARIAKIFHPQADVNLRSFETEFITETGKKLPVTKKYQLVIGNPPYGEHRGVYKGLGEESKLSKYEDYFVKRSLDVLDEGGILAMVLPSSWMDRHQTQSGYRIENAYRLPSGAFKSTQVGTDIVILRKESGYVQNVPSDYFAQHPEKVLGEIKERSTRFGRMEKYVSGDIDSALEQIQRNEAGKVAQQLQLPDTSDEINDIANSIDETGSASKTEKVIKAERKAAPVKTVVPTGKVELKKGQLKYNLKKGDEVVAASEQFPNEFTPEQEAAFKDCDYSGVFRHPEQHMTHANYHNGNWMHDFYYAEGNIYAKLEQLERDKNQISAEQYAKQKQMLQAVLPEIKPLDRISLSPNTAFVANLNLSEGNLKQMFLEFLSKLPREAFGDSNQWEIRDYVENNQVYGNDKERNALVRERRKKYGNDLFTKYINDELSEGSKKQLEHAFNREYNAMYRPDYSKVPMFSSINKHFKGKPLQLTVVQRAGVGRSTVKGVGVLAHEVGFGKTLSAILSIHEAMTRGTSKRPIVAVPNDNILKQWVETIHEVLPESNVNVLGNLGVDYDLTDFSVNDGEITLVTYEGFKAMGFKDETYDQLARKFHYITDDLNAHKSERDRQKAKTKAEETKGKMKRGTTYNFEDFGFDWFTVDEVHNANHIVGKVKLDKKDASDFRSQSQRTSDLGIKTWLASQYIQQLNNGRNVLHLSATPFTNKPLEYYSILSLVANKTLERMGFYQVDQFFETFMEADNDIEIKADGTPTQKTNVRRFKNNGLFNQLLSEFIDIKGEDDNPDLVRPERHNREYKIPQNDLTAATIAEIQGLFKNNEDVLKGITHSRLVAFSPYASVYCPATPKNYKEFVRNSPKIDAAIQLIAQNKKDNPGAGQLIYSEIGVEYFPMIQEYLVKETGFKPEEVRIISSGTSNKERANIQNAFNRGEVKVIIGSPAIKEGINLQENTTDMYVFSLPYNFTQLRQVEGRSWRQGNKWANLRINYMLTNNSVDVFMLQRLQIKQGLYNEAMKKGADTVDVSDIDTSELKTALITDPETRADIELMIEKGRLESEKTQVGSDLAFIHRKFERFNELNKKLQAQEKTLQQYEEWAKTDLYWARQIDREKQRYETAVKELENEKQHLAQRGVDVDNIVAQEQNSKNTILEIERKIEALKERKTELVAQYTEENRIKAQQQGDVVKTYVQERAAENKNGFFVQRSSEPRFKIIGERGAGNLDKAEETSVRLDNLKVAREMEATKTPSEIRLATGWEKGVDGLWRYEVPDIDLVDKIEKDTKSFQLKLSDITTSNSEILKAYPELSNINIDIFTTSEYTNGNTKGSYDKKTNTITLYTEDNSGKLEQRLIELNNKISKLKNPSDLQSKNNELFGVDVKESLKQAVAEKKQVEQLLSNYELYALKNAKSTLIHEIQHAIQDIEGFEKGGSPDKMGRYTIEENKKILEQKYSHLPSYKEAKENGELDRWVIDMVNATGTGITKYEVYRRLAGETEARNASARMNMSAEERRNTLLSETADVAPEDQIVLMDGQGIQDARPEYRNVSLTEYAKAVKGWNERETVRAKSKESILPQAPKGDVKNTFGSVHEFTFADEDITEVRKKCS